MATNTITQEYCLDVYKDILNSIQNLNSKFDISFALTPVNFQRLLGQIQCADSLRENKTFLSRWDYNEFLANKLNLFFNIGNVHYCKQLINTNLKSIDCDINELVSFTEELDRATLQKVYVSSKQ